MIKLWLWLTVFFFFLFLSTCNVFCKWILSFFFSFFLPCFLWPHLRHTEVHRVRIKWELQLSAAATAMWDPSHICDQYHSSWQCWILNSLSEARDRTHIITDTSRVHNLLSHMGTPNCFLKMGAEPSWVLLKATAFWGLTKAFLCQFSGGKKKQFTKWSIYPCV